MALDLVAGFMSVSKIENDVLNEWALSTMGRMLELVISLFEDLHTVVGVLVHFSYPISFHDDL